MLLLRTNPWQHSCQHIIIQQKAMIQRSKKMQPDQNSKGDSHIHMDGVKNFGQIGFTFDKAVFSKIFWIHNRAIYVGKYFEFRCNPCIITIGRNPKRNDTIAFLAFDKRLDHAFLGLFANPVIRLY